MQRLTNEEKMIAELAIEHHKRLGHRFEIVTLGPYSIAPGQEACLHMVSGRLFRQTCQGCRECMTSGIGLLLYLRIGRGFTRLSLGDVKSMQGNSYELFMKYFGGK